MAKNASLVKGLLIAIIPAVAIYWLTQGLPNWLSKQPVVNPTQSLSFDGRVIDASARRLLSGVAVSLNLGGVTSNDTTDSDGRYLFVMANAAPPVAATLSVGAQGYQPYTLNIGPQVPDPLEDILLLPPPPAPAPASGQAVGAARIPSLLTPTRAVPIPSQPQSAQTPAASPVPHVARMMELASNVRYTKRPLATAVRIASQKGK